MRYWDFNWIYFAQREPGGLIKIGMSHNPPERRRSLWAPDASRTGARILAMIKVAARNDGGPRHKAGRDTELALHNRFASARFVGEWFYPTPDLLALIAANGLPEGIGAHG